MSTMSISDIRKRPSANYLNNNNNAGLAAKSQMYGYHPAGHYGKTQHAPVYYQPPQAALHNSHGKDLGDIADSMGRVSLHNGSYNGNKASPSRGSQASEFGTAGLGHAMTQQSTDLAALPVGAGIPQAYIYNGQLMFAGHHMPHAGGQAPAMPTSPAMYGAGHFAQPSYGGYHQMYATGHSPMSQTWTSSRVPSGEMPTLITPGRDSTSSHEHDNPGTPMTQYSYGGYRAGGLGVTDHSPNSIYAWSTPSPAREAYNASKGQPMATISPRLQLLIQQNPAIPRAVPAPYSPMKPLDRSLENPHGVTNVYIRGLQPETSDEMLMQLATRFGDIVSSKSIIDHGTGLCKGYGFVKYHNYKDAEDCIRAFHAQGYETSFARESFYSQLKKLAAPESTNLYISNLPKVFNEHELAAVFAPHKVCSTRILRDSSGHGRGVGFSRFESREVCDQVISEFQNYPISRDGEVYNIQLRYADAPEQKQLKAQTQAARVFRAREYSTMTDTSITDSSFDQYLSMSAGNSVSLPPRRLAQDRLRDLGSQISPAVSPSKSVKVKTEDKENVTEAAEA